MALEDKDIFNAICARYQDKPMDFIMEQYALAKKINMDIEKNLYPVEEITILTEVSETPEKIEEPALPVKRRYTKRSLKVQPQDAISDDSIFCCICGAEKQHLTARHIASHGITVEEYKKICGYPPEQKLMSRRRLAKTREIISKAQQARLEKKAVNESFNM